MITSWEIYWFTRLDPLKDLFELASVIGIVVSVVMFMLYPMFCDIYERDEDRKKKTLKLTARLQIATFFTTAVLTILFALIPTTKEMAAIKIVPIMANSDSMRKLGDVGDNMLDLANEWLLELRPKKEK